jgi:hypothetical protein
MGPTHADFLGIQESKGSEAVVDRDAEDGLVIQSSLPNDIAHVISANPVGASPSDTSCLLTEVWDGMVEVSTHLGSAVAPCCHPPPKIQTMTGSSFLLPVSVLGRTMFRFRQSSPIFIRPLCKSLVVSDP